MLIENSKKIVLKLGSSTVVDSTGIFKKKWVTSLIKEIIFFNKSDLLEKDDIDKKLKEFKNKIKIRCEVISVFSNKDIQKVKKLLIKNVN